MPASTGAAAHVAGAKKAPSTSADAASTPSRSDRQTAGRVAVGGGDERVQRPRVRRRREVAVRTLAMSQRPRMPRVVDGEIEIDLEMTPQ